MVILLLVRDDVDVNSKGMVTTPLAVEVRHQLVVTQDDVDATHTAHMAKQR